jgi:hypothetical protein
MEHDARGNRQRVGAGSPQHAAVHAGLLRRGGRGWREREKQRERDLRA